MKNIDICLVKYFNKGSEEEKQFNKVLNYFKTLNFVNVHVHNNNHNNIGLTKARNILLSNCKEEYVCFLDFDLNIIKLDWTGIINFLNTNETVALVAPVSMNLSSRRTNKRWEKKEYLACNFMIFKRKIFDLIGDFDERFFVAYADWDIIKRITDQQLDIYQDNNSLVSHMGFSNKNPNKKNIWSQDYNTYIQKHKLPLNRNLI